MAKGAASARQMAELHAFLARTYKRVLEGYMKRMDAIDTIQETPADELGETLADLAVNAGWEPSPAMLAAVAKFLKDNDIGFESDEIDELSATAQRLADKAEKRKRAGLMSLSDVEPGSLN